MIDDILVLNATLSLQPTYFSFSTCDGPLDMLGLPEGRLAVRERPAIERLRSMLVYLLLYPRRMGETQGKGEQQAEEHIREHYELFIGVSSYGVNE